MSILYKKHSESSKTLKKQYEISRFKKIFLTDAPEPPKLSNRYRKVTWVTQKCVLVGDFAVGIIKNTEGNWAG